MGKYLMVDAIIEGYKANEIAEDLKLEDGDEAAKSWFGDIMVDSGMKVCDMPEYHQFKLEISKDWDLYYDYGADYYFAVSSTFYFEEEIEKAIQYVRDNHKWSEAHEKYVLEQMDENGCSLMLASDEIYDEITALMCEYGEDKGWNEDWWEEEYDAEDIFFKL